MTILTALLASLAFMGTVSTVPIDQSVAKQEFVAVPMADTVGDVGPNQNERMKSTGRKVTVTAYTSEPRQTDSTPCIAADNSDICVKYASGEKICATNDHPLHAKLYIEGYGECTVRDRMNVRYTGTGRVDLYMGLDTPAAKQWGARNVAVSRI